MTSASGQTPQANAGEGDGLYTERCAKCHESGVPRAANRATLSRLSTDVIRTALTTMRSQASELTAAQIDTRRRLSLTGELVWKRKDETFFGATMTGAPTLADGTLYAVTSSGEEEFRLCVRRRHAGQRVAGVLGRRPLVQTTRFRAPIFVLSSGRRRR